MTPLQRAYETMRIEFGNDPAVRAVYERMALVLAKAIHEAEQRGRDHPETLQSFVPTTVSELMDREG